MIKISIFSVSEVKLPGKPSNNKKALLLQGFFLLNIISKLKLPIQRLDLRKILYMDKHMLRRTVSYALFGVAAFAMVGCSTTKPIDAQDTDAKAKTKTSCCNKATNPLDPFEEVNRATFAFNKTIDTVFAKPLSYVYLKYLPQPFQRGVSNFFDNLREITNVANDLLQFKIGYAAHDTSRFLINSTIGIGGLFDPASSLGLEHRKEDFGLTLYHWGYEKSVYLIIPFLGPSTIRDTIGLGVDYYGLSIWPWLHTDWKKYTLLGLDYLDIRASILRRESVLDVLAVDEYVFMRDAYFQHRVYLAKGAQGGQGEDLEDPYAGVEIEGDHVSTPETKAAAKAKKEVIKEEKAVTTGQAQGTEKVISEAKQDPEDAPAKTAEATKADPKKEAEIKPEVAKQEGEAAKQETVKQDAQAKPVEVKTKLETETTTKTVTTEKEIPAGITGTPSFDSE